MVTPSEPARWEAELHALRQELTELRNEQKELARTIAQLVQTFQALATHMGIASEPYSKKGSNSNPDLPGFA
jgi:prefoldin subunit 5